MEHLTNAEIRELKARGQRMEPTVRVGKDGLSATFLAGLDQVLTHRQLIKVKFDYFKEQKKELAPEMAEKTQSHLVMRVGNVVLLYRKNPSAEEAGG